QQDKGQPHDESAKNPPEEDAVLESGRHCEISKDQEEDEDIVDAESVFNHISGEELESPLAAKPEIDSGIEHQSQRDPDKGCQQSVPIARLMLFPMKDTQIERQHSQHKERKSSPQKWGSYTRWHAFWLSARLVFPTIVTGSATNVPRLLRS